MTKEEKFYNALKDVFIGAKVEGESGYINLMRIKSRYYENGVFPQLQKDIEESLKPFPEFKEELFDKLYTFFNRYFSESGSIYFRYTPIHQNIYEKVYTDDKDVILFWKTHMLYYVKTDRLFKNLETEIDGFKFFFDVSNLEYKRANEKKEIIYEFKNVNDDGVIIFNVFYSERGKITKIDEIIKELKTKKINITDEILEKAFRIFEKQSEVDYFINKNAEEFLKEQFNIWLYQYVFSGESDWNEKRIKELQALKDIAFKIICFISQFENELVKIWNKPKFVFNSNYVITLDRIAEKDKDLKIIEKIIENENFDKQIKEWKDLGIVDDDFNKGKILENSPFVKGCPPKVDRVVKWYELPYNPSLKNKARELRKAGNLSEVLFWNQVKNRKFLGLDFDRQKIIGNYIVDFYCKDLGIIIEIDGITHDGKIEYDEQRDNYLKGLGLKVIHIRDLQVKNNLSGVLEFVKDEINKYTVPSDSFLNTPNPSIRGEFKYLPIDTKYFKDLEIEILGLFDDLDNSLDGWLIKSENYQALNTILPKFKEKVQTIYIDPPYNTGSDEFIYTDKFRSSSWLAMMENRLEIAKELMRNNGVIFVSIANSANYYKESYKLGLILENLFDKRFSDLIWKRRSASGSYVISDITEIHEYIFAWGLQNSKIFTNVLSPKKLNDYVNKDNHGLFKWHDLVIHQYTKEERPNLFYGVVYNFKEDKLDFKKNPEDINQAQEIVIYPSEDGKSVFTMTKRSMEEVYSRGVIDVIKINNKYKIMIKKYLYDSEGMIIGDPLKSIIDDNELPFKIGGTAEATKELRNLLGLTFNTIKPTNLVKLLIYISSQKNDLILDYFAGSGTTAHAVMKLNKEDKGKRKFILIEMADSFDTVIIPRLKKIAYSFNWKEGKPEDNDSIGIFFKYYELEQYEDTLRKVKYEDSDLFYNHYEAPYNQYIFMKDLKMLKALEIDYENNKVKVDLSKLYQNIDIPETLSNLLGKWIKRISTDEVEFEDGEKINIKDLDYKLIKPLIWW